MNQQNSIRPRSEPSWSSLKQRRHSDVPADISGWLGDRGSLTRRVIQACDKGAFRVRLLHQSWGLPLTSECRILKMRRGMLTLVRDVELLCDEEPWVFARTLIPVSSLKGSARRLTQLGERPLGAVLFSDPTVQRGATQIARLLPGDPLYEAACNHVDEKPPQLWGRRTLFYVGKRPLLVSEIFLPGLPLQAYGKQ